MKTKNIKKLLFVFLVSSFFILVIVPGTRAVFSEKETATINLNVEAPTFTVTFDGNGGTASFSSKDIALGHVYGELPTAEKCGSTFSGWYTGLSDGIKIEEDSIFNVANDQTLYAHYEDNRELYDVLKCEVKSNAILSPNLMIKKYTGEHQDSIDETKSTKNIYHYYGIVSDDIATNIGNSNNVLFADQCWQIIRTTDTGGVKLLYNGEPAITEVDGDIQYDCGKQRQRHIGYDSMTTVTLTSSYYYGTSYQYDSVEKLFSLSKTISTGEIKTGQYTCRSLEADGTCSVLYYVDEIYSGSTYYVIPLNSNSHYSEFGILKFNEQTDSPAYVGYMYNEVYQSQIKNISSTEYIYSSNSLAKDFWYSHNAVWGNPAANAYNLINPYQIDDDYSSIVGEYTFRSGDQSYVYTEVLYIAGITTTSMFYIKLESGHDLDYYNYTYTFGDDYQINNDGTYTIKNTDNTLPIVVSRINWFNNYSQFQGKYVCKNAIDNTCDELWYVISASLNQMTYIIKTNEYKYASNFEYKLDEEDGTYKYFLKDGIIDILNIYSDESKTKINNAHYTCFNSTGKCTEISYIYYIADQEAHYINLNNGKNIVDAKNEMLYNVEVNSKNSTVKKGIDLWYEKYLIDYSDYLEDTIFCFDRTQSNENSNGWNPDGGNVSTFMIFKGSNDLKCPNNTDSFSTLNNEAKLDYKIGLISYNEMNLVLRDIPRRTGSYYWLGTPDRFQRYGTNVYISYTLGDLSGSNVINKRGIRPSISLIPGIKYTKGTGKTDDPYVIDYD